MKQRPFLTTYGVPILGAVLLVNIAVIAVVFTRGADDVQPLPVLGSLPDFRLVDQHGNNVVLATLADRVWVADFVFTTCAGPCPTMSRKMAVLQRRFSRVPELHLVSFSVNPEYDTPEVLREYGQRFGAVDDRWTFLTGDRREIQAVAAKGFRLGEVDEPIHHSTYFSLVDGLGRLRGYYDSLDNQALERLEADIRQLLRQG